MNNTLITGLMLIETLAEKHDAMGITELARLLGLPKSNVHRVLQALVETGYVAREESSGTYGISIKLWEVARTILADLDIGKIARPFLQRLTQCTGETSQLSILNGYDVVYLEKVDSSEPVHTYTPIGSRVPAHCTATGKIMLSSQPEKIGDDISKSLVRYTGRTFVDLKKFRCELRHCAKQGYAINRGEWREGVWGVAASIRDNTESVVAAVGISGPAARVKEKLADVIVPSICDTARQISAALGGSKPAHSSNNFVQ